MKKRIFYFIFLVFSFSRGVLTFEDGLEDFSGKKVVGYFTKRTADLRDGEQDLFFINQQLLEYKREVLTFSENDLTDEGMSHFLERNQLKPETIKQALSTPLQPSSKTLWNDFRGRLKGNHLCNDDLSYLYRRLNPSRKITLNKEKEPLKKVVFSNCHMMDETFLSISSILSHLDTIEELDLSGNQLTIKSLPFLLRMARNQQLSRIILTSNASMDEREGWKYIRDNLHLDGQEKVAIMSKFQFGEDSEQELSLAEKLLQLSL